MMHHRQPPCLTGLSFSLVLAVLFPAQPLQAQTTVLEQRLAELEPCRDLKLRESLAGLPIEIGIEQLDDISLRELDLKLRDDRLELTVKARLACRTRDDAPLRGDASISLTAHALTDLTNCGASTVSFSDVSFGGLFGPVLQALWGLSLERTAKRETGALIGRMCTDLAASG